MLRHTILRWPGSRLAEGLTTAALGAPDHALALDPQELLPFEFDEAGAAVAPPGRFIAQGVAVKAGLQTTTYRPVPIFT